MKVATFIAKACICWVTALSIEVQAREVSGVNMPASISVAGEDLRLNGIGVRREKVLFKTYVIGFYLKEPTTEARTAIQSDEVKRLVITMLRDIDREMFVQAIESGIMRNSGPVMSSLRARLDQLEHAVPDLKKGDVLDLTWIPATGMVVHGQGRTMTIPGEDFSEALLAVWLGPNPVEPALKRALLGG
jgi:hypothetical protein